MNEEMATINSYIPPLYITTASSSDLWPSMSADIPKPIFNPHKEHMDNIDQHLNTIDEDVEYLNAKIDDIHDSLHTEILTTQSDFANAEAALYAKISELQTQLDFIKHMVMDLSDKLIYK